MLIIYYIFKNFPDKAKPFVRGGRKAAGLINEDGRAAEGLTFGEFGFFLMNQNRRSEAGGIMLFWH
jgi:hypothetical protein